MVLATPIDIQNAIKSLSATDFAVFSKWFDEYEQTRWDDQLAEDQSISSGLTSVNPHRAVP